MNPFMDTHVIFFNRVNFRLTSKFSLSLSFSLFFCCANRRCLICNSDNDENFTIFTLLSISLSTKLPNFFYCMIFSWMFHVNFCYENIVSYKIITAHQQSDMMIMSCQQHESYPIFEVGVKLYINTVIMVISVLRGTWFSSESNSVSIYKM